jgi:hypothetical protein
MAWFVPDAKGNVFLEKLLVERSSERDQQHSSLCSLCF